MISCTQVKAWKPRDSLRGKNTFEASPFLRFLSMNRDTQDALTSSSP